MDAEHCFWNPAEQPGYSGVLTRSLRPPVAISYGLGDPDFDREGRVIWSEFESFTLANIYAPSGQRDHSRLDFKLGFCDLLLQECRRRLAAGTEIVLCGDFNIAHQEIDLHNPQANRRTSGFLPVERDWIDRFLQHGFADIYRELHPERRGYTWWSQRPGVRERDLGWRLDYFLISRGLVRRVRAARIHPRVMGSDHCPVSLELAAGRAGGWT